MSVAGGDTMVTGVLVLACKHGSHRSNSMGRVAQHSLNTAVSHHGAPVLLACIAMCLGDRLFNANIFQCGRESYEVDEMLTEAGCCLLAIAIVRPRNG